MAAQFSTPPPAIPEDIVVLSYPAPHILHVAMNRPKAFNAMSNALNGVLENVFNWFENEPELWVAILGTTNPKAWCAGMDLKQLVSWRISGRQVGARRELAEGELYQRGGLGAEPSPGVGYGWALLRKGR